MSDETTEAIYSVRVRTIIGVCVLSTINFGCGLAIVVADFNVLVAISSAFVVSEFALLSMLIPIFEWPLAKRVTIGTLVGILQFSAFAAAVILRQGTQDVDQLATILPFVSLCHQLPFWAARCTGWHVGKKDEKAEATQISIRGLLFVTLVFATFSMLFRQYYSLLSLWIVVIPSLYSFYIGLPIAFATLSFKSMRRLLEITAIFTVVLSFLLTLTGIRSAETAALSMGVFAAWHFLFLAVPIRLLYRAGYRWKRRDETAD